MRRPATLWLIAFLVTAASAVYQRLTGPSHPAGGKVSLAGQQIRYRLPRSHGDGDAVVSVPAVSPQTRATISWKRYKSADRWSYAEMERQGGEFIARLPHQPPAGKLSYRVILQDGNERVTLGGSPVVIRFRGEVPPALLGLHIACMFSAMLFSARCGLEYFRPRPDFGWLVLWTLALLTAGGLILGPAVQKYAFGAYWTGWPLGTDLTDNKTAVAWLAWLAAWLKLRRPPAARAWPLAAAIVTVIVFAIPHSLWGSGLK